MMLLQMQREMPRELAGYLRNGAPHYLDWSFREMLTHLQSSKASDVPEVYALPGRGFLLRRKGATVAYGPAGIHAHKLAPIVDCVHFGNPLEPFDRHDALHLRALARNKPVFVHLSFHLPGYGPLKKGDLIGPSETRRIGKTELRFLGRRDKKGRVTPMLGLQLRYADGFSAVFPSLSALPDQVELAEGRTRLDLLVIDPDHQAADRFVEKLRPRTVVLEGFFDLTRWSPTMLPRNHRFEEAAAAIERFGKHGAEVHILAPGQRIELGKAR